MQQLHGQLFFRILFLAGLLGMFPVAAQTALFPFQLPASGFFEPRVDLSGMNHRPAGSLGRVTAGTGGRLYAGDQRLRFVGVNFTSRACFPERADAERIARRLSRLGVNIVRFHLMDSVWAGEGSIFDPGAGNTRHLSSANLEKLDYFFAQLKASGIYANLNLLTARIFEPEDGVDASISQLDWKEQQTVAFFDPAMIALQKEYASQLLGHVNPYTGLAYRNDPAVAIVEIINEHGLMHAWHLGSLDTLPAFFSEELRGSWNRFLRSRYPDTSTWQAAWGPSTLPGPEVLTNPSFASGIEGWTLEEHSGAAATVTFVNDGPSGQLAARLEVNTPSEVNWHIQLNQAGLTVKGGDVYSLRFWARADRAKTIHAGIGQAHDPWAGLGFYEEIPLSASWQQFQFFFKLTGSDTNARLNFSNFCDERATYWLSGISLTKAALTGAAPDESLEAGTVKLLTTGSSPARTEGVNADWSRFLWTSEEAYFAGMRDHLKNTLGVEALLMGTVVGTSTPNLMASLDMVDSHAYWQHPRFEVSWDSPWWIENTSMVTQADGGTLSGLSLKRVAGKPFCVSEYNHPAPNSFGSEAMVLLSAYAALQDWDAIFAYTYSDSSLNWDGDVINGYFDFFHDPAKMMSLAAAAHLFRRGDVSAARQLVTVPLSKEDEIRLLPGVDAWRLMDAGHAGMPPAAGMQYRTALVPSGGTPPAGSVSPRDITVPSDGRFLSDTGELIWDAPSQLMKLQTPRSIGFAGYAAGKTLTYGEITLAPGSGLQGWASVFLTSMQEEVPLSRTQRMLLFAHGLVENRGFLWQFYPSRALAGFPPPSGIDLTLGNWGGAPVEAEGISCKVELPFSPGRVAVYAMDGAGKRISAVPVTARDGHAAFEIGPSYRTLWYEVTVEPEMAPGVLTLSEGRVEVTLRWRNQYNGTSGTGTAVRSMDQYGYFWFTSESNPEVFVKVLDFGGDSFLVFHAALSDLEYEIEVKVLRTGKVYTFKREAGSVCGLADGQTVKK